jgi:hypothetical protein
MSKTATVEVWVLVDEDGDYDCAPDEGTAADRYADSIAAIDGTRGLRRIKVTLIVPRPAPIEVSAEVPAEEGGPVVKVGYDTSRQLR